MVVVHVVTTFTIRKVGRIVCFHDTMTVFLGASKAADILRNFDQGISGLVGGASWRKLWREWRFSIRPNVACLARIMFEVRWMWTG